MLAALYPGVEARRGAGRRRLAPPVAATTLGAVAAADASATCICSATCSIPIASTSRLTPSMTRHGRPEPDSRRAAARADASRHGAVQHRGGGQPPVVRHGGGRGARARSRSGSWRPALLRAAGPGGERPLGALSRTKAGIYAWTKRAFGEGHGFMCGWCYWVNNILYYPNLLMSTAVVGTYAIGPGRDRAGRQLDLRAPGDARGALARRVDQHRRAQDRAVAPEPRRDRHLPARACCSSGSACTPRSPGPPATPMNAGDAHPEPRATSRSSISGPRSPSRSPGSSSAPSWEAR